MTADLTPDEAADAERFLAPLLADLDAEYDRPGGMGLPRMALAMRTRLLDAPRSVAIWLTRFIEAAPREGVGERRDVSEAVQLLGALHAVASLPALFRLAVRLADDCDANPDNPSSPLYGALWQALDELRSHVRVPLLAFLDGNDDNIGTLIKIVAQGEIVHDETIYGAYLAALEAHPSAAATALTLHCDPRALPALRDRLASIPPSGDDDAWCRAIGSLCHAIVELGGELAPSDRHRNEVAAELDRVLYAARCQAANEGEGYRGDVSETSTATMQASTPDEDSSVANGAPHVAPSRTLGQPAAPRLIDVDQLDDITGPIPVCRERVKGGDES